MLKNPHLLRLPALEKRHNFAIEIRNTNFRKMSMKNFYMMAAVLIASSSMSLGAQSLGEVTAMWGKAITTPYTTQGSDIARAQDGSLYLIGGAGTKATTEEIKFGDDVIGTGTLYTGTSSSGNQALFLSKVDTSGNPVWTVYSTNGEVSSNQLRIAATGDGGVVAGFKYRHTSDFGTTRPTFVDATGNVTTVDWTLGEPSALRHYSVMVMKVSAAGAIEWVKRIDMNHDPQPAATYWAYQKNTPDAISLNALLLDRDGNIYLTGRMSKEMYVPKADGTTVTIPAHNNEEWDGDSQKDSGNLLVLKLSQDGNYVSHVVTGGQAAKESPLDMVMSDGKIYLLSLIKGIAGTDVTLGNCTVTPANDYASVSLSCLDTDLSASWMTLYPSELKGSILQTPCLKVGGDNIWIAGKAKMTIGDITTGSLTRAGLLLKVNASDGTLQGGHVMEVNQSGYFDCFESENDTLYVMGHSLFGPLFIEKFDKGTMLPVERVDLYSTTADVQGIVTDHSKLYAMNRTRGAGNAIGNVFSLNPDKFSCMVSAYDLGFQAKETGSSGPAAVEDVDVEKTVTSVLYYNLQGVASIEPFDGVNIVVTSYSDGSKKANKILR